MVSLVNAGGDDDLRDPEAPTNHDERALQEGFTLGRVVWFGGKDDWWGDWCFYVDNEHTLISTWRGHALHPFERFDRVCYFLCVVCFSLFMSAYIQHEHPVHESLAVYCFWVAFSSFLLVVYDLLLRMLATCPCVQPGAALHGVCWLCRDCFKDAGKQSLYIASICSLGLLIAGVVLAVTADVDPGMYFATFGLMRVCSYVAEFGPLAYGFYSRREGQREYWLEGAQGGAYPLGFAKPDPLFVRETRTHGVKRHWPGSVDNPMHGGRRNSTDLRRDHAAAAARRERQVEMLKKAREQVRSQDMARGARQPSRSPPPATRAPPPTRSFGPQSDFGAPDDALDSFGARR